MNSEINDVVEIVRNSMEPEDSGDSEGTVLVVDDDEDTRGLLRDLLEINGFEVHTASEGRDAVSLAEKVHLNLVITDIQMPGIDGLELLRRLGKMDDTIPVVLVTGFGELDNVVKALRQGAYDFLQKPINTEILLKTVRRGMEHYRLKRFAKDYTRVLEEQVEERTRELARTNDFLRGILNSSEGVAIVLTDFSQNILFWNTGAERIFGYTAEEMIGRKISKLYADDIPNMEIVSALRKRVSEKVGTVHGKVKQIAKDGRILTLSMALSPMLDSSSEVRGILSLGQDVTEEVRLHEELLESYERIKRIQNSSVFSLAKLAECRDGETGYHLKRIQDYCRVLCEHIRTHDKYREVLSNQFIDDLVQSSVLHDIGKVAVPDSILFNPKKFGVGEYEIMKQHTLYGGRALEEAANETGEESFLSMGRDVAYYHHEHWNGNGYPFGLEGEEIPLAARIVAIVDVYDALTTERRYKRAYTHQEACGIIIESRAKQFDPDLVDAFLEVEHQFREIRHTPDNRGVAHLMQAAQE